MKKAILISSFMSLILFGCKENKSENLDKPEETKEVVTVKNEEQPSEKEKQAFSWNEIKESSNDIGAYPYITPPEGMVVDKQESKSYDFDKLEFFDGTNFFVLDGKVERMRIEMDGDKEWEGYLFEKSVSDYLKSIGAKLIFDGQIPKELTNKWGDTPNAIYAHKNEFYASDVVNKPVSMYLLKTADKKIGFQVSLSKKTIGMVEVKEFKQTIEKITADDILNDINTKGLATLHINFDTGKSRIKSDSYAIISEIVKMMKSNPKLKIGIDGHTDNVGDESSNLKLSKNRARSVLMALTDEGIDEERLKSEGYGQSKPLGDNATNEGKAQNRRVELRKL